VSEQNTSKPDPTIDLAALTAWMDREGLGDQKAPVSASFLSGGSQNHIFRINRGEFEAVLRKPPATAHESRNDGILREWRIIEALNGTDVPHTEAIAVCTDHSVLGNTFYLMGFVDGWSPMSSGWPEPFRSDLSLRPGLAREIVRGVACMGAVDWEAKGLADLGRPDGYHERQVERWLRFYDRVQSREIPGMAEATAWLQSHKPKDFVPGIMHGDYQFANVMFEHGAPARLSAIIDWEMGTIGDPKLDLAWVVQMWPDKGQTVAPSLYYDITGMPSRDELVQYYSEVSGRQVDDMDYYVVLARWKMAIVLEQTYKAGVDGKIPREVMEAFGPIITTTMARAAEFAANSDYR
jgi:aminoglycoside phosphotransferase (APT) family kinase protein